MVIYLNSMKGLRLSIINILYILLPVVRCFKLCMKLPWKWVNTDKAMYWD